MESQHPIPSPLEQYASYPFNTDEIYQQGLVDILTSDSFMNVISTEEREEILRRTRVFYFNKTSGNSITLDEAREYDQHSQKGSIATTPAAIVAPLPTSLSDQTRNEEETRVLSFAELKELIEAGRLDQIPNNKVIPNDLNEAYPSSSTTPTRKKPWEIIPDINPIA